jgi:hypothetical protein
MGHDRLGVLPRTQSWTQVVELLDSEAASIEIAAQSMNAARADLAAVKEDPIFRRAYWLLFEITEASRHEDFPERLKDLGFDIGEQPSLLDLSQALSSYLDEYRSALGNYSDVGEMGQFAAAETLTDLVAPTLPSIFGATTANLQAALRPLSRGKGFGRLSRRFLGRFLNRFLSYYLSRELSNHLGPGRTFESIAEQTGFEAALKTHCLQAARITEQFASEWQGKAIFERGHLKESDIQGYLYVALEKLSKELGRG